MRIGPMNDSDDTVAQGITDRLLNNNQQWYNMIIVMMRLMMTRTTTNVDGYCCCRCLRHHSHQLNYGQTNISVDMAHINNEINGTH